MPVLSVDIPVLETDRLVLREPRADDMPASSAFMASDRASFVGGGAQAVSRDGARGGEWAAWRGLTSALGHWLLRGFGSWTIEDRAIGKVAGRVGFIHHSVWPEPELGWHIYDGFEGKGIAYEAAMAARAAGLRLFGLDRVISHIDAANTRSRRLAERMGAVVERDGELLGRPCLVYRHPAEAAA